MGKCTRSFGEGKANPNPNPNPLTTERQAACNKDLSAKCPANPSVSLTPTGSIGVWKSNLVANNPATHLVILLATSGVIEPLTATSGGSSPTHPVWGGVLPPHRGTLLRGA